MGMTMTQKILAAHAGLDSVTAGQLIEAKLDVVMAKRKIGLTELSREVDITMANLSILKNNKAKAVRFTTLEALCKALHCQPGDLMEYVEEEESNEG